MRQTIVITGASSGLGLGMARQFAARGRNLALCARREDRLTELRAELLADHPTIQVVVRPLDVTDHDAVFTTFAQFKTEFGTLDRVIVNAGVGAGRSLGTGGFAANLLTAQTNFVGALAQCEAALEIFRAQGQGHLVLMSSVSAFRGLPRTATTYAATKAALASLGEGLRADLARTEIRVSTIFPGYIRTEMTARLRSAPFMVEAEAGTRAIVAAIERERATAIVPGWPWRLATAVMRRLPDAVVDRIS